MSFVPEDSKPFACEGAVRDHTLVGVVIDDAIVVVENELSGLTGVEALVRLPMLQHQRDQQRGLNTAAFISGYRGSPVGGVDQAMWKAKPWLEKHNVYFQPGVNEDLAATAVWGSQQTQLFEGARYDGVFGMWYGKGPGVDRSMDVIKHANAFGTSRYGGVLAVAGDDHACKSSTLPHQSDHMFIGATSPVLNPTGVQEILDLGIYGWELSRFCGCWIGFKTIAETVESSASVYVDPHRIDIVTPEFDMPPDGVNIRWPDLDFLGQERRHHLYKLYAALAFARANAIDRVADLLARAERPLVLVGKGAGWSASWSELRATLEERADGCNGTDRRSADRRFRRPGNSSHWKNPCSHGYGTGVRGCLDPLLRAGDAGGQGALHSGRLGRRDRLPHRAPAYLGDRDEHPDRDHLSYMPSTTIMLDVAEACLMALAGAYSSEAHHSLARSNVGNSRTTTRFGVQSPSSCSAAPPRTMYLPSYAATVAAASFLYSSY